MKFKLLFLPDGGFTCGREAYICALPSIGYEPPDPRAGHILLTTESTNEAECHAQIDSLINNLKQLMQDASLKFKGME